MDIFPWHIDEVWVYYPAAALLVLLCLAAWLTNFVTLPGNWIVVALAAGFAWLFPVEAGRGMSWITVGALVVLAVLGEVLEFAASAVGAAKKGASRRAVALSLLGAMLGSILGLVVGAPVPLIGSLVMAVLGGAAGAFAGAYLGEAWLGRSDAERISVGKGAFIGRIWGTVAKLATGAVMLAIVAFDAFI